MVTARFDDLLADTAWVFGAPDRVLTAWSLPEVTDLLAAVDRLNQTGSWAWGYVSYEAAPAFDAALRARPPDPDGPPLACFAIGPAPVMEKAIAAPATSGSSDPRTWRLEWSADQHHERVARVQAAVAAGDVYQVNLTTRLDGTVAGDPLERYAALVHAQRGAYNAYLDLGRHVILSASPELFFQWDADGVTVRPMKGTARRGQTNDQDAHARAALMADSKERAENVMIVDLLRNDLSRLAQVGSVQVHSLLDAERYETVWQLTSTMTAQPRPRTTLTDVFTALFPCGSVTGAPKAAATDVIARLETTPRGVYCGAVGMLAPPGSGFRARFSVPIRTAVLDRVTASAVYGTGGAITWDSDPDREYDELVAKAAILDHPTGDFQLLETLRFEPEFGLRNLERHLRRMMDAAYFFGFPADPARIRKLVGSATELRAFDEPRRVRLLLARDGYLSIDNTPLRRSREPVRLALDTRATAASRWTRHKTTRRDHYLSAAARHPAADDVMLLDSRGEIIETTRANLVARIGEQWCTPPLTSGCLPGVERQRLLEGGEIAERVLTSKDVVDCDELAVISSLRGWRPAEMR